MIARLRSFFRNLLRGNRVERALDDELRASLDLLIEERLARGIPPAEARRLALIELGGVEPVRQQVRSTRTGAWVHSMRAEFLWRDVLIASRRLRAAPVFTIFASFSLAVGIGGTTAVYSALTSIDLGLLRVKDPAGIAFLVSKPSSVLRWHRAVSRQDFARLRADDTTTGFVGSAPVYRTLSDGSLSEIVAGEAVTPGYFETLDGRAIRGRLLQAADDNANAPSVVVVSESFWRGSLGADPGVIGRVIRIGGRPFEIVGVADRESEGLQGRAGESTVFWISLSAEPAPTIAGANTAVLGRPELTVFARVPSKDAVRPIASKVAALGQALDQSEPAATSGEPTRRGRAWSAVLAADLDSNPLFPFTAAVVALVALVLVIASTNIANLVIGRGVERAPEYAMRRALGATRWHLMRESLAESAMLAVLGTIGAYIVMRLLFVVLVFDLPVSRALVVRLDPEMNVTVLVVSIIAGLLALVVFGLVPALRLSRPVRPLVGSGITREWRLRRRAITWQVAISTGLLLLAMASVRATARYASHDSGIDLDRLAVALVNFRTEPWTETTARAAIDEILAGVRQDRRVEAAAVSSGVPFGLTITPIASMTTPDRPFTASTQGSPYAYFVAATPRIFGTLGVPIVRGRSFGEEDGPGVAGVAVLSETAATRLFGATDPLGRTILLRNYINMLDKTTVSERVVIGIARDTDTGVVFPDRRDGTVYVPLAQHYEPTLAVVARASTSNSTQLVGALGDAIRAAHPDLAPLRVDTGVMMLLPRIVLIRTAAGLTLSLAALGTLFAMAGLSGVLLQLVAGRRRETGIRAALGAGRGQLVTMILREGLHPVLWGVGLGLAAGTLARGALRSRSADIAFVDPWSLIVIPAVLVSAALVACYFPARRASGVDPNVALRDV